MTQRRRLVLLMAGLLLLGAVAGHAQVMVIDIAALVKHVAMVALQREIREIKQGQAERIYKMAVRISHWTNLGKYLIRRDDMPEWRIRNWFTDDVLYAKPYHFALTYGDATGDGYERVSIPRQTIDDAVLDGLGPESRASVASDLALIDLADSAIIRGTHDTGRLRYNGRAEAESIIQMQEDVTDGDFNQSLAAVMDKMAGAALVEAQNKQTRWQFQTAILEQLLVDQAWERHADAAQWNSVRNQLQAAQDGEWRTPSLVDGAADAFRNWRLP